MRKAGKRPPSYTFGTRTGAGLLEAVQKQGTATLKGKLRKQE